MIESCKNILMLFIIVVVIIVVLKFKCKNGMESKGGGLPLFIQDGERTYPIEFKSDATVGDLYSQLRSAKRIFILFYKGFKLEDMSVPLSDLGTSPRVIDLQTLLYLQPKLVSGLYSTALVSENGRKFDFWYRRSTDSHI